MTTLAVRNNADLIRAIKLLEGRQQPFTLSIAKGAPRSIEQNKLQRKWMLEAQEQGDQTAEEYRAYCKLHFGVPIMRHESPEWKEQYDRIIKPLPYEQKLAMMAEPIDFPVTRAMKTKGKAEYLDKVYEHFTGQGMRLTLPGEPPIEAYQGRAA